MNLVVEPIIKNKKIQNTPSNYKPSKEVLLRFSDLRSEMMVADEIRNQTYREFNNRSLIQYQDDCQKVFNNYITPIENEDEAWRANTVRPLSHNRVINIVAQVTSSILAPIVEAQNENSISDKDSAMIMKDLMDYVLEQCKYSRKFVYGMIAAAVNPAVIFEIGYLEVIRKFKEILKNGEWKEKEKLDEVFSGFFLNIVPVEELFIGNIYEHDIQKQPFLFRRRVIDYSEAKIKYGKRKNFKYVSPGVRVFFDADTNSFYEGEDEELNDRQVEELVYYNYLADLELTLVNGVLLDEDPDRPLQREDKKYPFAKGGYELIDEGRFFYYKSLVDKMSPDQNVLDIMYNMILDGSFLQIFPPMANYGGEAIHSNIMVPGSVNKLKKDSELKPVLPPGNLTAGLNVMQKVEASASESSQDSLQDGQVSGGDRTKYEVQILQENAKRNLGLFGKMIGFLVEDIGDLMMPLIIQYMTMAEVEEVVGDIAKTKYQSVLVPDRTVNGKKMSRRIDFEIPDDGEEVMSDFQVPDLNPEEQLRLQRSAKIKYEEDKLGMSIAKVNPMAIRTLKWKVKNSPDFLKPMSEEFRKILNLEAYDRMSKSPWGEQKSIFRDFLVGNYKPGDEDKYIAKEQPIPQGQMPEEQIPQEMQNKRPNKNVNKLINRRLMNQAV